MPLSVGTILWAGNRPGDHGNHLHVEPPTRMTGEPPLNNPGMTAGVKAIYDALTREFGDPAYFQNPAGGDWTHMGYYNRRKIAGTNTWSQHAYGNALDIGPYYGIKGQQRFYDFLTGVKMDYEIIGGYKWYDVDEWPTWAAASIRKNIVAGVIRGVQFDPRDPMKRKFKADEALTRGQAAVLMDRIGLI